LKSLRHFDFEEKTIEDEDSRKTTVLEALVRFSIDNEGSTSCASNAVSVSGAAGAETAATTDGISGSTGSSFGLTGGGATTVAVALASYILLFFF
jgi:hypothetical protein